IGCGEYSSTGSNPPPTEALAIRQALFLTTGYSGVSHLMWQLAQQVRRDAPPGLLYPIVGGLPTSVGCALDTARGLPESGNPSRIHPALCVLDRGRAPPEVPSQARASNVRGTTRWNPRRLP